jgi:hypothetical protein
MYRGVLAWNRMKKYYMMWLFLCIDSFVLYLGFNIFIFILYFEFFVDFKQWTPL